MTPREMELAHAIGTFLHEDSLLISLFDENGQVYAAATIERSELAGFITKLNLLVSQIAERAVGPTREVGHA